MKIFWKADHFYTAFIFIQLTFREALVDFLYNCTFTLSNISERSCSMNLMQHWVGGAEGHLNPIATMTNYFIIYVSFLNQIKIIKLLF